MIFRRIKEMLQGFCFFLLLFRGEGGGGGEVVVVVVVVWKGRGEIASQKSGGLMHLLWGETVSN